MYAYEIKWQNERCGHKELFLFCENSNISAYFYSQIWMERMTCFYVFCSHLCFLVSARIFFFHLDSETHPFINWFLLKFKLMVARINYSWVFNIVIHNTLYLRDFLNCLMFSHNQFLYFSFSLKREFKVITGSQKSMKSFHGGCKLVFLWKPFPPALSLTWVRGGEEEMATPANPPLPWLRW